MTGRLWDHLIVRRLEESVQDMEQCSAVKRRNFVKYVINNRIAK